MPASPPRSITPRPTPAPRAVRIFAAAALLAVCATFFAAQVDFFRRYRPPLPLAPARYWRPQLEQIWAPGLGAALIFAAAALACHFAARGRRESRS